MKKALAFLLAAMMLLALCACGGSNATTDAADNSGAEDTANTEPADTGAAVDAGESEPAEANPAESTGETYTVGICQLMQHDALDAATRGFRDALTEALGDAVTFDEQNAQGDSATCSTIVTGFVANDYDLIMANATPALQAAIAATAEIPILGTCVTDYPTALSMEFDPSDGTGINVSGSSDGVPGQLYADLVVELLPEAKNVSVLYCSAEANSVVQADDFIAAAENLGLECTRYTFADSNDMQAVVTAAVEDCDALYIPTDNTAASNMTIVDNICEPAGVPVICGEENMCGIGGLATVTIDYYNVGYICGKQAVEVLMTGADVSTMPIAYVSDPVKKYNAAYAESIGFEMPDGFETIG